MRSVAALLIVALLAGPVASYAGQTEPKTSPAPQPQPATIGQKPEAVPVPELPVSVERIRRKLAQAPRAKGNGLRLEYYVEVYGKSPRIDLFTDFDPTVGPVQYGSPTHREFLDVVTPEEFRAPAGDLLSPVVALMKWLAERGRKKPDSR
jgi:hypothetical protein